MGTEAKDRHDEYLRKCYRIEQEFSQTHDPDDFPTFAAYTSAMMKHLRERLTQERAEKE